MRKIIEVVVKYDDGQEQTLSGENLAPWAETLNWQINGVDFPDAPNPRTYTDPDRFLADLQTYTEEVSKLSR
jgi:hypothetical protein